MSKWTEDAPMNIFVTVGTNHNDFKRMLELVDKCLASLVCPYRLFVQYGKSTPYVLKDNQNGSSNAFYSRNETERLVKEADLVFSHCGIGSIYNALIANRPTVIIPRLFKYGEFTDDHQLQIAKEIKDNPLIFMIDEVVDIEGFKMFVDQKVPQPKVSVDLTNKKLAQMLSEKLLEGGSENSSVLTVVNAGGHLTQSLCVMSAVKSFHLVTSLDTGLDVGAKSYHFIEGTQFNKWVHFKNIFSALKIINKVRPAAIFSTGGPICLPFALVAKVLKIKFIYLDTLSRVEDLSNTARFLYKYNLASELYVQWAHHTLKYPNLICPGKTFDICGENNYV